MLIYHPPDCKSQEFSDIKDKVIEWSIHLPSPLPDVIITGDFNMPNNDWANSSINSSSASHQTISLLNVTKTMTMNNILFRH